MKAWWWVGLGLLLTEQAVAAPPPADAVITKDLVAVSVAADGTSTVEEEDVIQVLTPAGVERFDKLERLYNSATTQVTVELAEVIDAQGEHHAVPAKTFHDEVPLELRNVPAYQTTRALLVEFPRVAPGMSVHFDIKTTHKVPLLPGQMWETSFFQDSAALQDSVFQVSFPESLRMNWHGTGLMQGVAPTVEHAAGRIEWRWHAGPASAVVEESAMPAAWDVTSKVTVSTFSSWDQVADGFARLWERAADPTGVDLSRYVSRVHGHTPAEKLRDVMTLVMSETTEVGLNTPPNEWPPMPLAQAAVATRLTDTDRCVLLLALARACGLQATPALATSLETGSVDRDFPAGDTLTRAVVVVPNGGTPWILDPASDTPGLDVLRPSLIDQSVLVLSSASPVTWLSTGVPGPVANREVVRIEARLDQDGSLSELLQLRQFGAQNAIWRDALAHADKGKQMEFMTGLVQQISPQAVVSSMHISKLAPLTDPLREEVRFDIEPLPGHLGRMSLHLPILPEQFLSGFLPGKEESPSRQQPLVLGFPLVEEKWLHLVLPDGMQLEAVPDSVTRENGIGSYQLTLTSQGRNVWALSRLILKKTRVSAQEYPEFVDLVQAALHAEDTPLALVPVHHARE